MQSKKALITGASEGIGRAFALRLAHDGYQVTAVARNASRLQSLIDSMPGSGHTHLCADLSTEGGIECTIGTLVDSRYSLVVNNAGITHYGLFADLPWDMQREVLDINCNALTRIAYSFLGQAQAGDALVNISSMLSFLPQPTSALYSASKAFVTSLSEALWYENRARGIYVVGVHPGVTHTEFRRRGGGSATRAPWAQAPEQVVQAAMRALAQRRRCTVISGAFNRALATVSRLLPRQTLVRALGDGRSRTPDRRNVS